MAIDLPPATPATIFVDGEAITPAAGSAAFGVLQLSQEELQPVSGRVEDALRQIGGLQLFRPASTRSANPTSEGITSRGFAGNAASRMEVTLDGAPLADPFFGFISWGSLIGQPLQRGELIRGGGQGGPGALTGTLKLSSAVSSQLSLRGGSRNSYEGNGMLAVPVEGGAFGISGGYSQGDGYLLVKNPGSVDIATKYRQWSLAGTMQGKVGSFDVTARIAGFDDQRLRGVEDADITSSGGDFGVSAVSAATWHPRLVAYAKLRDFSTVTRPIDATRTTANTTLDQMKTPSYGWGFEASVEPPLGERSALQLGVAYRAADGRTEEAATYVAGVPTKGRVAGGDQQVASAFFDGSQRVGDNVLLTASARVDRWRQGDGRIHEFMLGSGVTTIDEISEARSGTEGSGRIGAMWQPASAVFLRAAGYRSWRLPTLNELYRPFRVGANATAANPLLKPERLVGGEASLSYQPLDSVNLSVTGYRNRMDDLIAKVTLGQGPGNFPMVGFVGAGGLYTQRQNVGEIESKGVEAEMKLPVGPFDLRGSLAYAHARVRGGPTDGMRPSQAPELSGSVSLGWSHAGFEVLGTLRHFGARYEDDRNTRRLPAATTIDASIAVPVFESTQLVFSAENLTDSESPVGFSGSQFERGQPRTFWAGVRWVPGRR